MSRCAGRSHASCEQGDEEVEHPVHKSEGLERARKSCLLLQPSASLDFFNRKLQQQIVESLEFHFVIMGVKVYGIPMSTATRNVLMVLMEKEVDFELVPVDMKNLGHKSPEHLAMNPFGKVPVYQDDDITLFGESCNPLSFAYSIPSMNSLVAAFEAVADLLRLLSVCTSKASCQLSIEVPGSGSVEQ